jgi:hypothetical protein
MTGVDVLARIRQGLVIACIVLGLAGLAGFGYLETKARHLNDEINTLRAQAAALKASRAIMQMTVTDSQSLIDQAGVDIDRACNLADRLKTAKGPRNGDSDALLNVAWNICPATPGSARPALNAFLGVYFRAVTARLTGDFAGARDLYAKALEIAAPKDLPGGSPTTVPVPDEWLVRAAEGLAYTEMRQGRLPVAEADAKRALALRGGANGFVFADTTALKVKCRAGRAQPAEVQSDLAAIRADFDGKVTTLKGQPQCYARLDRGIVEQDDELFLDCAKAGVSPMKVDAPLSCADAK